MRNVIALLALASCAVSPRPLAPSDPASASAPTGRLAGAPASLRPGVVAYPDMPKPGSAAPVDHSHHHGH